MLTRRQTLTALVAAATAAAAPAVAATDETLRLGAIFAGPPMAPGSPLAKSLSARSPISATRLVEI